MGIMRDLFSVLVPGGGAILRRKYLKAAVVIIAFLALLECWAVLVTVRPLGIPEYASAGVMTAMLAIVVANAVAEVYHLARRRHRSAGGKAGDLHSQALSAYIVGDDRKAEELITSALRLDEINPDFVFLKGQIAARMGKARRARRLFRKCASFDEYGKWKWEIEAALARL